MQRLLAVALADAEKAGIHNASFRCGDAQTTMIRGFDRIFSAFGVMFFAQPVAALRNLHAATKLSTRGEPGRMQLLVWGPRADNPWLTLAVEACNRILPPKTEDGPTCGPGPFSMSDPDVLRAMLESAGLTRIELHGLRDDVLVGANGSTFEQDIAYSRAVVDGDWIDWIFVSGTTGFDYTTMSLASGLVEQTEQCLYFGDVRPAATMLFAGLMDPRMQIEIEVTARLRA